MMTSITTTRPRSERGARRVRFVVASASVSIAMAVVTWQAVHAQGITEVLADQAVLEALVLAKIEDQLDSIGRRVRARGSVEGTWEGTLTVVAATSGTPERFWKLGDHPELRLVIADGAADVRVRNTDWQPIAVEGGFQATELGGSGFVYAVQSVGGWVEDWNLSIAKKDDQTLLVFLSFVAGGTSDRLDAVETEFAVGAMGELRRAVVAAPPSRVASEAPQAPAGGGRPAGAALPEPEPPYDGAWEGEVAVVGRYGEQSRLPWLRVDDTATHARLDVSGTLSRLRLGKRRFGSKELRVMTHDAAALAYRMDIHERSIETWQWSLTKLDSDRALVFAWRVDGDFDGDVTAQGLLGELQRVREPAR